MNPSAPLPFHADASAASSTDEQEQPPEVDLVTVTRVFNTLEAEMLRGCLKAEGIPATLRDVQTVQTDTLLAGALGGVRVMVPAAFETSARHAIESFERGEFAIDELPPGTDAAPPEAEPATPFGMPRRSLLVMLVLLIAGLIVALVRPGATMH